MKIYRVSQPAKSGVSETTFENTPNLKFDKDYSFGSENSPESPEEITVDFAGARVGQCCYCVINAEAEPDYAAGIEKSESSAEFEEDVNNYFLFTYNGNNKVMLTIIKKSE
ncbi:MAG: hypothetical protein KF900_11460 [Bacteroidetes bacterium]|nr:hypothetical protein [Bacteroidota bacterium]